MSQDPHPATDEAALRDWLRDLKERSGLSDREIAQAIGDDRRNVVRWLSPTKPAIPGGDIILRLLGTLGVEFTPEPPRSVKGVNQELEELRALLEQVDQRLQSALAGQPAEAGDVSLASISHRLQSLEDRVQELPSAKDLGEAVLSLRGAIEGAANAGSSGAQRAYSEEEADAG